MNHHRSHPAGIFPPLLLVLALLMLLLPGCRRVVIKPSPPMPRREEPEVIRAVTGPVVRVCLQEGIGKVSLAGDGCGLLVTDIASGARIAQLSPGVQWESVAFGPDQGLRLAMPDGRVSQSHPSGVRVKPVGEREAVRLDGHSYRGELLIYPDGHGGLQVVNYLPVEDYLRSVVPAEIGRLDDQSCLEALKAQAVASRSFVMSKLRSIREFHFDVSDGTRDQVYKGMSNENRDADRAIRETAGECMLYKGKPIPAFYHSTCGGRTAEPSEVWGRDFARTNGFPGIGTGWRP